MNNVIFTFEEANQVLNTLRSIQMSLGAVMLAVPEGERERYILLSNDMAGAIMQAVDLVEQTIFESGIDDLAGSDLAMPPSLPEPSPN